MPLTDLKLKNIPFSDKVKLYADGDGLYLRTSKTKKRWYLAFMKGGKPYQFYAQADYPEMSLKDARKWAANTREMAEQSAQIGSMSQLSFKHFADEYREQEIRSGWAEDTIRKYDLRSAKYFSAWYSRDIREITPQEVLLLLKGIESAGHKEAARQVRMYLNSIFICAKFGNVLTSNPCEGVHQRMAKQKTVSRAAIIDIYEFGELLNKLDAQTNALQVKTALQLHALIFTRPVEMREAPWSEISFEKSLWVIPKERMKMGETDLMIPLAKQTKKLLAELKKHSQSEFVFGMGKAGRPYSDAILRQRLNDMGYYGSQQQDLPEDAKLHGPHGFRASFRTIAAEVLEWRVDVLEHQLNHMVKDANGNAYNRATFLEKRQLMMQLWADFCDVLKSGNKKQIAAFIKKHKGAI